MTALGGSVTLWDVYVRAKLVEPNVQEAARIHSPYRPEISH